MTKKVRLLAIAAAIGAAVVAAGFTGAARSSRSNVTPLPTSSCSSVVYKGSGSPASHFFVSPTFVFAGLTIASGPGFTRLSTGTSILAQLELKVPTTPITERLLAYRRALVAHFAESQPPVCAVESSHD